MFLRSACHKCLDKLGGHLRYYGVAVSAQSADTVFRAFLERREAETAFSGAHKSQAIGNPISQPLSRGFNWPPLSIPAVEPVSISPVAVSRAGVDIFAAIPNGLCKPPKLGFLSFIAASRASHCSTVSFVFTVSAARGVGQPAKFACLGSWSSLSDPSALGLIGPVSFQSLVVVVVQPAICAAV